MKRILRSFLTLLMLVVWVSGFAADKTYSYTFKSGGSFTADKQTKTFGGVNWTITSDGYLSFEGNNKAQQIGSKKKPAKNTVISTSDFPGTIKTIEINGWQGTDANANVEVFVGGVSYGKKDFSTNKTDEHIFNGASSGALKIQIINPASGGSIAAFIKTISVTYEEGPAKTATTLTFPKSVINIEEGNEASFAAQTAKLKAGETVLKNAVTYTTNNDAMFEAYEANVGPKALKAGAYGTAVVTATFAGDDTYAASTATYTVNYTEKAKPATTLDFGFATKTVNINETFTATATLKAGEATISGKVTYTSSKSDVAYVDETTGEVLALTAGKTTITATFAGTSEYKSSTASYDLTVVDPNAPIANIVFDKADDAFGTLGFYNRDNTSIGEYSLKANDGNLYVFKTNGGKTAEVNGNLQLKKTSGSLESPVFDNFVNGYVVNVTFSQSGTSPLTITSGGETKKADISDGAGKNTNGIGFLLSMNIEAGNNFMLNAGNAAYISKIEIIPLSAPLTLSETDADTDSKIEKNNGKTLDVTLTRTLTAGVWNTICLPFDVTAEQIANVLKSEGNVKEYGSEDASKQTIYFKDATTMVAGKPYLIKPTEDAKELVFKGMTIKNVDAVDRMVGDKYNMCGVFGKYAMNTDGTELFLKTDGKFYVPAVGKETMKGFRAYFLVPKSTSGAALNLSFGDATGINGVAADAEKNVKVYNVNGQYVGTSLEALPKGLYIVGGKKVLK